MVLVPKYQWVLYNDELITVSWVSVLPPLANKINTYSGVHKNSVCFLLSRAHCDNYIICMKVRN